MSDPHDPIFLLQSFEAKVGRARYHLNDLLNTLADLRFGGEAYEIASELQADGITQVFTFRELQPLPADLPLVTGDFLHNCRSALDNLIYALWAKNRGQVPKSKERRSIGFPIAETSGDFHPEKQAGGIPPECITLIEEMQPYHRSDRPEWHPLAQLSRLSNIDKHRHIHVGFWQFEAVNIFGSERPTSGRFTAAHLGPLVDGTEVARFIWSVGPHQGVQIEPTCDVVFNERYAPDSSVEEVARSIYQTVLTIRNTLVPFL